MNMNRPELFFVAFVGLWIGVLLSVARLGVGQRLQLSTASQDPLTAIVGDSRAENCAGR